MRAANGQRRRRLLPAVRAMWGSCLLWAPEALLRGGVDRTPTAADRAVLRVLGVRHLGQAALSTARPAHTVFKLGEVTDLLHAATCLGLIVGSRRWRRAAAADFFIASGFAAASRATANRGRPGTGG